MTIKARAVDEEPSQLMPINSELYEKLRLMGIKHGYDDTVE
jgi:hypothetical protein